MQRRWPDVDEHGEWAIAALERQLNEEWRSAASLRARADELRAQAQTLEIPAMREATLLIAERYEEAAAARTSA